VYNLPESAQNVGSSNSVPFRNRKVKNGEKSRERYYLPVCSRLTHVEKLGTGPKDLTVMRVGKPWNAGLPFFYFRVSR
jgi:hypothetical protein